MYLSKKPKRGYNAYIDTSIDDLGMLMDIGLLVMEPGATYMIEETKKGKTFGEWNDYGRLLDY